MINVQSYMVLDFETTGLKAPAPVSLAVAHYTNGKRDFAKNIFFNPEKEIEFNAYKVHGISQEEAEKHPNFAHYWPELKPYFENSLLIAHNAKYDIDTVLIPTLIRYNIPVPTMTKLCTRDNARLIVPNQKKYTLDALCDYFGIVCENHHTASFDTMMCQRIFARLYNLGKEQMFSVTIQGDYDPKVNQSNSDEDDFDF